MSSISKLEMPTELKERIEKAAREGNQNSSSLVERAFALFLTVEEAHLVEVRKAAAEADAGDIFPHEEVERQLRAKYVRLINDSNTTAFLRRKIGSK